MKELTIVNTTISNNTPIELALGAEDGFTTAKRLYDWLELDDSHYSRWVQSNIIDNPFAEEGVDFSPLMAKNSRREKGRPTADYRITASFAKKLAMLAKSERGEQARIYFLMCERTLVKLAKADEKLKIERAKGIAVRKTLTDVILISGENARMKGHAFSTYTNLAYKAALGKSAKQLRKERGIEKKENIRDYLSEEEVESVKRVENVIADLLDLGWTYPEIKEAISRKMDAA